MRKQDRERGPGNPIEELLTRQADLLARGEPVDIDLLLDGVQDEFGQVRSLLAVAEGLKRVLVPLSPPEPFREYLHQGLVLGARHRQSDRLIIPFDVGGWRYWWIGAAAVGSAVAAGGIIAWRMHAKPKPSALVQAN